MQFYELRGETILPGLPVFVMDRRRDQCVSIGSANEDSWVERVFLGREDFPVKLDTPQRYRLERGDYQWTRGGRPMLTSVGLPEHFDSALVLLRRQDRLPERGGAVFRAGQHLGSEQLQKPQRGRSWVSRDGKVVVLVAGMCVDEDEYWDSVSAEYLVRMDAGAVVRIDRSGFGTGARRLLLSWVPWELRIDELA